MADYDHAYEEHEIPPRKRAPPPGCSAPEHRKGFMKTALNIDRAERIEIVAKGPDGGPVEATDIRDLALKLGAKAMRVLESDLQDLDPHARQEAARALAAVCVKFADQPAPTKPEPTQEEREAQLEAALASPRLRAFLESRGWRRLEPGPAGLLPEARKP